MSEDIDITELFSRDPLSLTRDDITAIIKQMRNSRRQFVAGNLKAGAPKKSAKATKAAATLSTIGDLGDL